MIDSITWSNAGRAGKAFEAHVLADKQRMSDYLGQRNASR